MTTMFHLAVAHVQFCVRANVVYAAGMCARTK